jgi:hypothetical protein
MDGALEASILEAGRLLSGLDMLVSPYLREMYLADISTMMMMMSSERRGGGRLFFEVGVEAADVLSGLTTTTTTII